MRQDYNRLLLIAVADAVIALVLAAIVLVMIITAPPADQNDPAPALPQTASTTAPASSPTIAPTQAPTLAPTVAPTVEPTVEPTVAPTVEPTVEPTPEPTPEIVEPQGVPHLAVAEGIDVTYLDQIETGKVTGDGVHVRTKPDSSGRSLDTFDKNQSVQVYGSSGRWYLVKIGDVEGFMSKTYVSLD